MLIFHGYQLSQKRHVAVTGLSFGDIGYWGERNQRALVSRAVDSGSLPPAAGPEYAARG